MSLLLLLFLLLIIIILWKKHKAKNNKKGGDFEWHKPKSNEMTKPSKTSQTISITPHITTTQPITTQPVLPPIVKPKTKPPQPSDKPIPTTLPHLTSPGIYMETADFDSTRRNGTRMSRAFS